MSTPNSPPSSRRPSRRCGEQPDLDKHEAIWSDDIVLIQPMSPPMRGKKACRAGFERIFKLIPDLTAEVHSFGHGDKQVFIEFTLSGTYAGEPIAWRAVDRFTFTDGLIAERISYFDAVPLVTTLAPPARLGPVALACALGALRVSGSIRA